MEETALISVIVPVYKVEKYLDRCVQSIVDQTYRNLEIILVDDGSPDNCGAMCDAWAEKDSRIKVIHKENGGVTSARLCGIEKASGEWIGFVDGDDRIEPWMYQRLIDNAETYQADISHCGYQMILPTGRVRMYYNTGKLVVQDNHMGVRDLLKGEFVEPGLVNKVYKRALVCNIGEEMNVAIKNNEDLLIYEDVCPYIYILREGSATKAKLNIHQLEDPLIVRKILFAQTKTDLELQSVAGTLLVRQLVMLATMNDGDNQSLVLPVRKKAKAELRGMLSQILALDSYGKKIKLIALWAAIWPWSYGFVHGTYEKIRGYDKLYEK